MIGAPRVPLAYLENKYLNPKTQITAAMSLQATPTTSYSLSSPFSRWVCLNSSQASCLKATSLPVFSLRGELVLRTKAKVDERGQSESSPVVVKQQESQTQTLEEVEKSVKVLKNAAKTRKVAAEDILSAFSVLEKAKIYPTGFLDTLGGSESPGRTWMLIFTAEKQFKGGRYFPLTAVQRFDAAAKRIENGVYFGPIGCLTFEGRLSWKNRMLAFVFECIRVKIGPLKPLEISLGKKDDREPSTKDPFFIWFYIDEEIAVARGKSGGTAFWCRCHRVTT